MKTVFQVVGVCLVIMGFANIFDGIKQTLEKQEIQLEKIVHTLNTEHPLTIINTNYPDGHSIVSIEIPK